MKGAKPIMPIVYLIRMAGYKEGRDCFQLKDGYGEPVSVEHEALLHLNKSTLWRVGHDLHHLDASNWRGVADAEDPCHTATQRPGGFCGIIQSR